MKESEQTIEKHPTQIRVLLPGEINQAVECFSTAIARDWPNSKEEAASWVADEFPHAGSIIFGAYDNDKLVGTCSLVTASYVIERLKKDEKELVIDALQKLEVDLAEAIYIGGFSVEKKYEARGTSSQLFTSAQNFAISKGYTTLIAHTARPSGKYQKIQALPLALLKIQMRELILPYKVFYLSPDDLEKVWLYKSLNK